MKKSLYLILLTSTFHILPAAEKISIFGMPLHQCGPLLVREGLLNGLEKINHTYNFNPRKIDDIAQTAVVLSSADIVDRAIYYKKKGVIKHLIVGPNLVVLPQDENGILTDPAIDLILVPCEWVKIAYEQEDPNLMGKIKIWYAGVDTKYWQPATSNNLTNNVLIYNKTGSELFCLEIQNILKNYGYNPIILQYGSYDHTTYKELLHTVQFAVFISATESQGISMAEAWSMNVPTLVWDPQPKHPTPYDVHHYRTYTEISACPYLTNKTGATWKTTDDFKKLLQQDSLFSQFKPREWVLKNMTQEKSAELLASIVESFLASKSE